MPALALIVASSAESWTIDKDQKTDTPMGTEHLQQFTTELEALQAEHRLRTIPDIDYGADTHLKLEDQWLLNLGSNNYLGLSRHPELIEGALHALHTYGTTSGASRLVTGTSNLARDLEQDLARFKGQEAAVVLGSGFAANLALLSCFADRKTVVFSDRLNHASIIDGITLSRAQHTRYRHLDLDHLAFLLARHHDAARKICITDSVFSMDGDCADLEGLVALCREHNTLVAVDEAHAAGVFGQGRGLAHALGLEQEIDLHMGTWSKAFASLGGYIAGTDTAIRLVHNTARSFIYSTALPPAVLGTNRAALRHVDRAPEKGAALLGQAKKLRDFLQALGLSTGKSQSQIIPILLGESRKALKAQALLKEQGVFVPAIRPPTVPQGQARLRLSLRADLAPEHWGQLKTALTALAHWMQRTAQAP